MKEILEAISAFPNGLQNFLDCFFDFDSNAKLGVLDGDFTITKGTKLYRIRKADGKTNFDDPQAWDPPPISSKCTGRFNVPDKRILYVSSDPTWLEREVELKAGETYFLGTYVCENDFSVASLLGANEICNILHMVAKAIKDEKCLTVDEQKALQKINYSPFQNGKQALLDPFFAHTQLPDVYKYTQKIAELLLQKNGNGIRYCSAFDCIETVINNTVFTVDGIDKCNYALTDEGRKNISFQSAEKKICKLDYTLTVFFNTMSEEG